MPQVTLGKKRSRPAPDQLKEMKLLFRHSPASCPGSDLVESVEEEREGANHRPVTGRIKARGAEAMQNEKWEDEEQHETEEVCHRDSSTVVQMHGVHGARTALHVGAKLEADDIARLRPFVPLGKVPPMKKEPPPLHLEIAVAFYPIPFDYLR